MYVLAAYIHLPGDLAQRKILVEMKLHGLKLLVRQKPAVKGAQGAHFHAGFQPGFLRVGDGRFLQGDGSFTAVNAFSLTAR